MSNPTRQGENPEEIPKPKKLTTKEQLFIDNYLVSFNAADAACKAGYSEKTARSIGYENLTKPHIQILVAARKAEIMSDNRLTIEYLMKDLTEVIDFDINEVVKIEGKSVTVRLTEDGKIPHGKMIKEVTIMKDGALKLKFYDKEVAREMFAKYAGVYAKDNEQKKPENPIQVFIPENNR